MTAYDAAEWSDLFVAAAGASAALAGLLFLSLTIAVVIVRMSTVPPASGFTPSRSWVWTRWSLRLVGTAPFVIGGLSLLLETGGGLYWIAAGVVFAIVGAVANAWVLLVEILR